MAETNSTESNELKQAVEMHSTGRLQEAEERYRRLLQRQPNDANVLYRLSVVLRQTGRFDEAVEVLARAVKLNPSAVMLSAELGVSLLNLGRVDEAVSQLEKVAARIPNESQAHFHLGRAYLARFEPSRAIACLERACAIDPKNHEYESTLGMAYLRELQFDDAVRHCGHAVRANPQSANYQYQYASALHHAGRLGEARTHYEKALELAPGRPDAIAGLANLDLTQRVDPRAICDRLEKCLNEALAESTVSVILALIRARRDLKEPKAAIPFVKRAVEIERMSPFHRMKLFFELGRLHEDLGDYDEAFECFQRGNALYRRSYHAKDHTAWNDRVCAAFSGANIAQYPRSSMASAKPVFIVGMPRSGTTLVEQILSAHPEVYGADELPDIHRLVNDLRKGDGKRPPYPDCFDQMTSADLDALANRYLARLDSLAPGAKRVTDKMPHNFNFLGLIWLLFPQARIIHCKRNPLDTCLSIYALQMPAMHTYAYSLENLGHEYREYERMMAHWKSVLPDQRMFDIQYEELVANQETLSRALVEFIGLDWHDDCLKYHESQRVASTLSVDQVRQPIYKSSIARHERYSKYLGPLRNALGMPDA